MSRSRFFSLGVQRHRGIRRQRSIQTRQPMRHGLLHTGHKRLAIQGLVERLIVAHPLDGKILWDIVIRIGFPGESEKFCTLV